jgi:hypothetical protein
MHKKSRIQSAIALLIGAALLVPVASIAQDQTIDPTDVQEASRECGSGYKRVGPIRTGYLAKGGTLVLGYNLTPGRKYCFVAVGDEQAIDVDLELLDRNLSSFKPPVADRRTDPIAIITNFTPKRRGLHNAQVEMFECTADQCEYALGTYRK